MAKDNFWAGMFIGGVLGVALVFFAKKTFNEETVVKAAAEMLKKDNMEGQDQQEKNQQDSNDKQQEEKQADAKKDQQEKDKQKKEKEDKKKDKQSANGEENTDQVRNSQSEKNKKGEKEEQGLGEAISGKINFKDKLSQLEDALQKLREEENNRG